MFNWLKNKYEKINAGVKEYNKRLKEKQRLKELAKYREYVFSCWKEGKNDLIGNFSYDGYKCIFETMITGAKRSIYIFCENYDKVFTDDLFQLLKYKISSGVKTYIITYNGKEDEKLKSLENENCKYVCVNSYNPDKINNFFVVDEMSYWMDDKSWIIRNNFPKMKSFKACANFRDFIMSIRLISVCNKAIEITKNNEIMF